MSLDFDSTVLLALGLTALMAGLLVVLTSIKLVRMKIAKEIGFLKARLKFRPRRPRKIYVIKSE